MFWSFAVAALASAAAAGGAPDVMLTVDVAAARHPISPLVYGINASAREAGFGALLRQVRPGLVRLGGNRWTAYNWENNASNAGSDYLFQNDDYLASSAAPGAAVLPTVRRAAAAGAATMVTIPNVDYVAADRNGGGDIRQSPDYRRTRLRRNEAAGGPLSMEPDTGDGVVHQDQFAFWLEHSAPRRARVLFSLDNEPDLWADTHPEVHPGKVTYAELAQRNGAFAARLKQVWPGAEVTGPANYGLAGYENLQGASDAGAHGSFQSWYLRQMAAAGRKRRILDDLDVHYYPEAQGGGVRVTGTETDPAVVAAREQAPRSLWDPRYVEDSWITRDYWPHQAIRLLPRLRDRIRRAYRGTGLAITEWNFGGGQHISGAIATADTLGILGRENVRAAAWWPLNADNRYALAAFRAFRNYDGRGGAFGRTSVRARSSDAATASVYASTGGGRTVVVAINKATGERRARLAIAHGPRARRARVFALTGARPAPRPAPALRTSRPDVFAYTMPAQSVSVLVLR